MRNRLKDRLVAISKTHQVSQEEKSLAVEFASKAIWKLRSELAAEKQHTLPEQLRCSAGKGPGLVAVLPSPATVF